MQNFDEEIQYLKRQIGRDFKDCFLAGGAINSVLTNRKINDFDLYFKNKDAFVDAVKWLFEDGLWCVSISKRAITFIENNEYVYQLMCFDWFETSQDIFERFDFSCVMGAIELSSNTLEMDKNFIRDIAKRKLRFNHKTQFPIGSAMRVRKYQERGYKIEDSEFLKVILACSFKDIKDWDDLKNQIGGQYGQAISMDTSKEFNLENAIESLSSAIEKPRLKESVEISSAEDALKQIFGE